MFVKTLTTISLKLHSLMAYGSMHYFEINTSDIITHHSLIWSNVDVKLLLLEQFELKEPQILLASLPKVLSCDGVSGNNLPPVFV